MKTVITLVAILLAIQTVEASGMKDVERICKEAYAGTRTLDPDSLAVCHRWVPRGPVAVVVTSRAPAAVYVAPVAPAAAQPSPWVLWQAAAAASDRANYQHQVIQQMNRQNRELSLIRSQQFLANPPMIQAGTVVP